VVPNRGLVVAKQTKAEKIVYLLILGVIVAMGASIVLGAGFGFVFTVIILGGVSVLAVMPFVLGKGR
jgi:hypothetical protein